MRSLIMMLCVAMAVACSKQDAKTVERDVCSDEARKAVQVLCDRGVDEAASTKVLEATKKLCAEAIHVQEVVCREDSSGNSGGGVVVQGTGDAGAPDGGGAAAPAGGAGAAPGGGAAPPR